MYRTKIEYWWIIYFFKAKMTKSPLWPIWAKWRLGGTTGHKINKKPLQGKLKRRFFSDPSKFRVLEQILVHDESCVKKYIYIYIEETRSIRIQILLISQQSVIGPVLDSL
jgi:hypothetical protein